MSTFNIAITVSIGLLTGVELAVSVFVNPVLRMLDNRSQSEAIRLFARRLGAAMPFWYIASFLLLVAATVRHLHQPGVLLLAVATGIWVAVILLSVLWLVPINNRLARMDIGAFPEAAQQEHQRWDGLHRLRVAALAVAFVFFLSAI